MIVSRGETGSIARYRWVYVIFGIQSVHVYFEFVPPYCTTVASTVLQCRAKLNLSTEKFWVCPSCAEILRMTLSTNAAYDWVMPVALV